MTSNWLWLSCLSALLLGLYDLAKKKAVDGQDVLATLCGTTMAAASFTVPVIVLSWFAPGTAASLHVYLHQQPWSAHALLLCKSGIVGLSWLFSYSALKHLPVTVASPLRATGPFFTVLGAILLFGERPNAMQGAGIACILAAYFAYSLQALRAKAQARRASGMTSTPSTTPWMAIMLLAAMTGAVSAGFDKYLLQTQKLPQLFVLCYFLPYLALLYGGSFLAITTFRKFKPHLNPSVGGLRLTPVMWAVGGLLVLADLFYFAALADTHAKLAVVSAIRRSNVLIAFAGGLLLFREKHWFRKLPPLIGILIGLALLLFASHR